MPDLRDRNILLPSSAAVAARPFADEAAAVGVAEPHVVYDSQTGSPPYPGVSFGNGNSRHRRRRPLEVAVGSCGGYTSDDEETVATTPAEPLQRLRRGRIP